jgi:hypothetical protein
METIRRPFTGPLKTIELPRFITHRDAIAGGLSDYALRRMPRVRDVPGVLLHPTQTDSVEVPEFADQDWVETYSHAKAVQLWRPQLLIDSISAARLYGFPLPYRLKEHAGLHIALPTCSNYPRLGEVHCRITQLYEPQPWFGLWANSSIGVIVGLANHMSEDELVAVIDGLAGPFHGSPWMPVADIIEGLRTVDGARNIALARRAATRARDGVRSPMETKWRLLIVADGMPEPTVNLRVKVTRTQEREIDLAFEDFKVAVEYHVREYHLRTAKQIAEDNRRRLELEHVGWKVVVITGEFPPADYLQEIRRELRSHGWRG